MNSLMKSTPFGFGIVGTGMIAGVVADALARSTTAGLRAVSSRSLENARKFTAPRPGVDAVEGLEALFRREDIEAVYFAIPTVAKEAAALAAIAAGKHVLVDKPFVDRASVQRMVDAAMAKGLVFMDATHFVHHARTAAIQAAIPERIGTPRSLHTTFYFPFSDRNNIRFDQQQEPMTALGDMAWYSARAIVEYLRPAGRIGKVIVVPERDPQTNAIVRAEGLIAFESGEVSTFDIGYTAGTVLMDLQLLGTGGVIQLDDFVLDWEDSWSFKNAENKAGYFHRTGMASRREFSFIPTPAPIAAEVAMVEDFAALAVVGNASARAAYAEASLRTQEILDAFWLAANA